MSAFLLLIALATSASAATPLNGPYSTAHKMFEFDGLDSTGERKHMVLFSAAPFFAKANHDR